MELIKFRLRETTDLYYLFTITIRTKSWFGSRKESYDCFRGLKGGLSKFVNDGECLFHKWLYIDNSIDVILSKSVKEYDEY